MFNVGTLDVLLDDSIVMSTKWAMSGAESILKLYPGAPHNFTCFSPSGTEKTEECLLDIALFLNERIN
jgi:acetyl esterase/lipase